jgi:alpha-pyrone synthase
MPIRGLGLAVPEASFTQHEAVKAALALGSPRDLELGRVAKIYERAGVERRHTVLGAEFVRDLLEGTRHSVSPFLPGLLDGPTTAVRMKIYEQTAAPLAAQAGSAALSDAGVQPQEITHLVTVSCTGFVAPGVDRQLIDLLGLPLSTERAHIGFMGCHGLLNGIKVAKALVDSQPKAVVLLVAVELCTLHHAYRPTREQLIANALFADGAAAMVFASTGPWDVIGTASQILLETQADMGWIIGEHGFEMSLSRNVPGAIAGQIRPWLVRWLQELGHTIDNVMWVVHPGGPRILEGVERALSLPGDSFANSHAILRDYGNMSSPTVAFIWDRCRTTPRPAVLLAFGPGLTAEAALISPAVA